MTLSNVAEKFLQTLDRIEYGRFELVTPDGKTRSFEGRNPGPSSTLVLNEWRVLSNLLARGDSAFAEDYKVGLWDTTNLQDLLALALANDNIFRPFLFGNKISQMTARLSYMMRLNTVTGSKKNIHAHYDLGNDFYKLWLDPSMTYSSALYKNQFETLESAQMNKYDRIIDRLGEQSGKILEVGCGWGGFADRASQSKNFDIRGVTISKAQHDYAVNRLQGRANIVLEDYRQQTGKFDHIVSIEMFEAVGERYWPVYFRKISDLLHAQGSAVIQTITIRENAFERYRRGGDMIRNYIFPGGMLPSPTRFAAEAARAGLRVTDRYNFGLDYARTLEAWLNRFDEKQSEIRAMGFDDQFIRLWRFYLAACIAGFRTGRTDVMQVELRHA